MENASKALLMAGGVLLFMMVVFLLIFAWGQLSDYYSSQDTLKDVENVAEFNKQMTQYDRDNISGYELVSLINRISDYNNRFSYAQDNRNDLGYNPVEITIDFLDVKRLEEFLYDDSIPREKRLFKFTSPLYTESATSNQLTNLLTTSTKLEKLWGGTDIASKIVRSIVDLDFEKGRDDLADKLYGNQIRKEKGTTAKIGYNDLVTAEQKKSIEKIYIDRFKEITGKSVSGFTELKTYLGDKMYQYYEYYQFKKAKFKCTSIEYDKDFGRVSKMKFEIMIKDGRVIIE